MHKLRVSSVKLERKTRMRHLSLELHPELTEFCRSTCSFFSRLIFQLSNPRCIPSQLCFSPFSFRLGKTIPMCIGGKSFLWCHCLSSRPKPFQPQQGPGWNNLLKLYQPQAQQPQGFALWDTSCSSCKRCSSAMAVASWIAGARCLFLDPWKAEVKTTKDASDGIKHNPTITATVMTLAF